MSNFRDKTSLFVFTLTELGSKRELLYSMLRLQSGFPALFKLIIMRNCPALALNLNLKRKIGLSKM